MLGAEDILAFAVKLLSESELLRTRETAILLDLHFLFHRNEWGNHRSALSSAGKGCRSVQLFLSSFLRSALSVALGAHPKSRGVPKEAASLGAQLGDHMTFA